jgi:hypothetical protein
MVCRIYACREGFRGWLKRQKGTEHIGQNAGHCAEARHLVRLPALPSPSFPCEVTFGKCTASSRPCGIMIIYSLDKVQIYFGCRTNSSKSSQSISTLATHSTVLAWRHPGVEPIPLLFHLYTGIASGVQRDPLNRNKRIDRIMRCCALSLYIKLNQLEVSCSLIS